MRNPHSTAADMFDLSEFDDFAISYQTEVETADIDRGWPYSIPSDCEQGSNSDTLESFIDQVFSTNRDGTQGPDPVVIQQNGFLLAEYDSWAKGEEISPMIATEIELDSDPLASPDSHLTLHRSPFIWDNNQIEKEIALLSLENESPVSHTRARLNRPGEFVFAIASKTRRRNQKPVEVGNNKQGRRGGLRCEACRNRKSKCVFASEDLPCVFCKSRNLSPCIKKRGPKTEERASLRTEVPALIPTQEDAVIDTQDGQILQYVYSPWFVHVPWAHSLTNLFKRFSITFGPTISKPSLRQAILAWGAAFTPLPDYSGYARMIQYSNRTIKAIRAKSSTTVDEADLFATLLLALLSFIYHDLSTFKMHVCGFITVARELRRKTDDNECQLYLATFWPLARDTILDAFLHYFPRGLWNPCAVIFCQECHSIIGPQSVIQSAAYLMDFLGFDPNREYSFCVSLWRYSRLLRVCFRDTVYRQLSGKINTSRTIASTVLEVKADINSPEVLAIVAHISSLKLSHSQAHGLSADPRFDLLRFSLLVYRFCEMLIALLEAPTLIEGISSDKAISNALGLAILVQPEWLMYPNLPQTMLFSRVFAYWFTPRVLWIAALCFGRREHVQDANWIIHQLATAGHPQYIDGLNEFWANAELKNILKLLDTRIPLRSDGITAVVT